MGLTKKWPIITGLYARLLVGSSGDAQDGAIKMMRQSQWKAAVAECSLSSCY